MKRLLVLLLVLAGVSHASASPQAAINSAVNHFRSYGYQVDYPEVEVVSEAELPDGAVAAAIPGKVYLTPYTADSMRILQRVALKPTVKLRLRAWRACEWRCLEAEEAAFHEVAHLVQYQYGAPLDDVALVEGYAEAVSLDLIPSHVRRLVGRTVRLDLTGYAYWEHVNLVRWMSQAATGQHWASPAAKAYRFKKLGA